MGALTDAVKRLIDSLQVSSASPGHVNVVLQTDPSIDLDEALQEALQEADTSQQKPAVGSNKQVEKQIDDSTKKIEKKISVTTKKVELFDKGNVGEIGRMSTAQFGNIKQLASNPFTFIIGAFLRKIPKVISRGGAIGIFVILIEAIVRFAINEALKPGRFLDRRFKRDITKEIIAFRRREDQQKLKQGFSQIIITTMAGLRSGQGQTYNTFDHIRSRDLPPSIGQAPILLAAAGTSLSKYKGRGRKASGFIP